MSSNQYAILREAEPLWFFLFSVLQLDCVGPADDECYMLTHCYRNLVAIQ